jgi:Etoposide-induced protein 2.4 (EI24)
MRELFDAFWRACSYCLHPRVMLWSLLPLVLSGTVAAGLGWLFWEPALDAVQSRLDGWAITGSVLAWLDGIGAGALRAVIAPLVVVALAVPLLAIASLLLVAMSMLPATVRLVAQRRFAGLERRAEQAPWRSALRSLLSSLAAFAALLASLPLWLIPSLALLIPPLVWGWLGYRVMSFEALAAHASRAERRELLRAHRWPLLAIGLASGLAAALPSVLWASSAAALVAAPLLVVLAAWVYTLAFAFCGLWTTHYALAALEASRQRAPVPSPNLEQAAWTSA